MSRADFPLRLTIIRNRIKLLHALRRVRDKMNADHPHREPFAIAISRIIQNTDNHYLAISTECDQKVSYAPDGIHKHDNRHRIKTTLGRYLRRQLRVTVCDHSLDLFVSQIRGILTPADSRFQIISGDAICQAYADSIGASSCMTGPDSRYTEVYAANPDVVQMLIYRFENQEARALLWTTEDGHIVLDRIYPNGGQHIAIIETYARRKDWLIRCGHSTPYGLVEVLNPHGISYQLQVTLDNPSGEYWPYMDTFRYVVDGDRYRCTLSNVDKYADGCLDSTTGGWIDGGSDSHSGVCHSCGDTYNEDDLTYTVDGLICGSCGQDYRYCEHDGEYRHIDSCVFACDSVNYAAEDYANLHWGHCRECGEWFEDGGKWLSYDDEEYCYECFHDCFSFCERCEEDHRSDDMTEYEGEYMCVDCCRKLEEHDDFVAEQSAVAE